MSEDQPKSPIDGILPFLQSVSFSTLLFIHSPAFYSVSPFVHDLSFRLFCSKNKADRSFLPFCARITFVFDTAGEKMSVLGHVAHMSISVDLIVSELSSRPVTQFTCTTECRKRRIEVKEHFDSFHLLFFFLATSLYCSECKMLSGHQ